MSDVPWFENLIGITYLNDATMATDTLSQRNLYDKALHWFEYSLKTDRDFMPAFINREKTLIKLANYKTKQYDDSIDHLIAEFNRHITVDGPDGLSEKYLEIAIAISLNE